MATVLERFKKLGLAYSNPVLQLVGMHVKDHVRLSDLKEKKLQVEDGHQYWVNDYHEHVTESLDFIILDWVKTKPTSYEKEKRRQWWQHYRQLPK